MRKISISVLIVCLISLEGCKKIEYQPDNPILGIPTKVLMHRGCGSNTDFIENTLPAAEYGLSIHDGIELDIQLSRNGTLWLGHDNEVYDCDGNEIACFQELNDAEIMSLSECEDIKRFYTLESVFELMSISYPESYISLDIKGQNCEIFSIPKTMRQMANAVLSLVDEYNMENKVLLESKSGALFKELENQSSINHCYISFGDLDLDLRNTANANARGISLNYGRDEEITADVVSLIHKKGFGVILWCINDPVDIEAAWITNPDFIQTDNPHFRNFIR